MLRLYDARDDEDEKRKVEPLIRPLLTSQSVNSVYGNGTPALGLLARDSSSLLAVALRLEPDPDIISQSLHWAIRRPQTPTSSVKALVDAGADVNFNPQLAFTDEETPAAFSDYQDDSPLSCMFRSSDFEKDEHQMCTTMEKEIDFNGIFLLSGAAGLNNPDHIYIDSFAMYDPSEKVSEGNNAHFHEAHKQKALHEIAKFDHD